MDVLDRNSSAPENADLCVTRSLVVDLRGLDEACLQAVRMLILADVMRRIVGHFGGVPLLTIELVDGIRSAAARRPRDALWIGEPTVRTPSPREAGSAIGGPADVLFTASGMERADADPVSGRRTLRVGPVTAPSRVVESVAEMLADDQALAVRLALLRFPPASPAELSVARLYRARETLQRWQFKVACWADLPTAPAPAAVAEALRAGLGALDTATVLTHLHRVEVNLHVAAGSKFDAFAPADRVLGLDLQLLVGKLRR